MASDREVSFAKPYGLVAYDADGDVFEPVRRRSDIRDGIKCATSCRNYIRNPLKNKPAIIPEDKKDPPPPPVRIEKFFGHTLGEFSPCDSIKLKKQKDGSLVLDKDMKLAPPYSICKRVRFFYAPSRLHLYKMELASEPVKKNTKNMAKVNETLKTIADAIAQKFSDRLEMCKIENGYEAKFTKEVEQKLYVMTKEIKRGKDRMIQLMIVIEDEDVFFRDTHGMPDIN